MKTIQFTIRLVTFYQITIDEYIEQSVVIKCDLIDTSKSLPWN
jgi:hypothetical protein